VDPRTEKMLAERRQEAESKAARPRAAAAVEDTTAWLTRNRIALAIGAAAVIAAVAFAWHLLVTLPALERERTALDAQTRQQIEVDLTAKEERLDACLTAAEADYMAQWDSACKARRAKRGCALLKDVVAAQERRRTDARNDCLQRYSLK
jgi:hypothetical protein